MVQVFSLNESNIAGGKEALEFEWIRVFSRDENNVRKMKYSDFKQ